MLRERVFGTLKKFLALWDFFEFQDRPIKRCLLAFLPCCFLSINQALSDLRFASLGGCGIFISMETLK